jgi:hypothetical protein
LVMFCWARMYIMLPLHEITSARRNNCICLKTSFLFCGNYENLARWQDEWLCGWKHSKTLSHLLRHKLFWLAKPAKF